MGQDASNITTGPFIILVDGTEVGHTEDNITFNDGIQTRERKSAQAGENVLDLILMGHKPEIGFRIAERTAANIAALYPEFTSSGSSRYFGRSPGYKMSTVAKRIVLRPAGAADQRRDICLFKGVIQARGEVGLNATNDTVYEATLLGLYDDQRDDGKRIGYVGVPAS